MSGSAFSSSPPPRPWDGHNSFGNQSPSSPLAVSNAGQRPLEPVRNMQQPMTSTIQDNASPVQRPQSHGRTNSLFASFRRDSNNNPQRTPSILSKVLSSNAQNNINSPPQAGPIQPRASLDHPSQMSAGTPPLNRIMSAGQQPEPPQAPSIHPEIRSIVQLTVAHAHKIYFSGPLIRKVERQPDGQRPAKDDGWVNIFAQLGGTTLSIWDMAQVEAANRENREVPPTYVNVTDAVRTPSSSTSSTPTRSPAPITATAPKGIECVHSRF